MSGILRFILVALLSCGVTVGFTQDDATEAHQVAGWNQVTMPYTSQNVQVPRELWQTIKDVLRSEGHKEEILDNFVTLPVEISVDLMADNRIALKQGLNHRVSFLEGGGDLDLFDFVVGKASFFIRFAPQLDPENTIHLLYVSASPGEEIEGNIWGNGCGHIYDLSRSLDRFVNENGLAVTASRRQYLHLMAGTYVFFQLVDERLYISYIRLMDSRYPRFHCQPQDSL
jgi:hypothetical protein